MSASSGAEQTDSKGSVERSVRAPHGCGSAALALLLERAGRGDQKAFADAYDATSARTFGLALRVLGDREEAEEVLHDAYLEIWRRCGRFEAVGAGAMAWVLTIVHRAAVQRVRHEKAALDGTSHRNEAATGQWDTPRLAQTVSLDECGTHDSLPELSDQQHGALTLAYFAGHTFSEVGHILGFGPGMALSLIRDGLIRLQERMEPA